MNYSRISEERKKLGLSQEELANKVGVSQKSISKYECGTRRPSYETLTLMAGLFGVSIDYLLGNDKHYNATYSNYQIDNSEFGLSFKYKLRDILHDKGLSEKKFSELIGLHKEDVDLYLYGNKIPSIEDLIKIAGALNVSADYLLDISEIKPVMEISKNVLPILTEREKKVIESFRLLNEDNQDIILGDIKKYIKEQRYQESVAADEPMKKAAGK